MIRLRLPSIAMAALALAFSSAAFGFEPLPENPLHNFNNRYDVDNNGVVSPRDLLLIFNELNRQQNVNPLAAQLESSEQYYWDTNNSGHVSPNDGLLVINQLLRMQQVPEPGAIVTGGMGLALLVGYCLRQRRKRA